MTRYKTKGVPVLVISIAFASTSLNVQAEQEYRFPPLEPQAVESSQPTNEMKKLPITKPSNNAPSSNPNPVTKRSPVVKSYLRPIPPGMKPPVARPYGAPPANYGKYNAYNNYRAPAPYARSAQNYSRPAPYYRSPAAPQNYARPAPYYRPPVAPQNYVRPAPNYRSGPNYARPAPNYARPAPNYARPAPNHAPNYRPPVGPGPYAGNQAGPWNRNSRSGPFNNNSFGRNFFDKGPFNNGPFNKGPFNRGPFNNGPFGRGGGPWDDDYDEDDNFGFFDMIPSDELEEIWDDMIAGPPDGEVPGPMNWPNIEMPGPFEVGEQVEDVMYEVPSFFDADGYGYDNE